MAAEGNLQKKLIEWLEAKGFYTFNVVGNAKQKTGICDLLAWDKYGVTYAIELKATGEVPKPLQMRRLIQMSRNCVMTFLADDFDEITALIEDTLTGLNYRSKRDTANECYNVAHSTAIRMGLLFDESEGTWHTGAIES